VVAGVPPPLKYIFHIYHLKGNKTIHLLLILLIEMHACALNQKFKDLFLDFTVEAPFRQQL